MTTSTYSRSNSSKSVSAYEFTDGLIKKVHSLVLSSSGWASIFSSIPAFHAAVERAPNAVPCPFSGASTGGSSKNGSTKFRFRQRDLITGCAIHNDYDTSSFSDGIDVLAEYWGMSKAKTCRRILSDFFGESGMPVLSDEDKARVEAYKTLSKSVTLTGEERDRRIKSLETLYHYTKPNIANTQVSTYLKSRGINRLLSTPPRDIGYNPKMYYKDKEMQRSLILPAMIAIYRDKTGAQLTMHRTYLDATGAKADVTFPKKMMKPAGDMTGGSIHLYQPLYDATSKTWMLGVAEGIENALSVTEATAIPIWAASSVWSMENMEIPEKSLPPMDVKEINFSIWADKDKANDKGVTVGLEAAKKLQERMITFLKTRYPNANIIVVVYVPEMDIPEGKKGVDWNDVLQTSGPAGFPVGLTEEYYSYLK